MLNNEPGALSKEEFMKVASEAYDDIFKKTGQLKADKFHVTLIVGDMFLVLTNCHTKQLPFLVQGLSHVVARDTPINTTEKTKQTMQ